MTKNGGIFNTYFERSILLNLSQWLNSSPRKPLVLRGARQVGKSTLVRSFCKLEKRNLFEVNLEQEHSLQKSFDSLKPAQILNELEFHFDRSIDPDRSLLFLDEIQTTPQAIVALRYFYEQMPNLPVIAAGSLLDFMLTQEKVSMPVGRIDYGFVSPLSFEEFLNAKQERKLLSLIQSFQIEDSFPQTAHDQLCQLLREYFFVGGMPEAVQVYFKHNDEKKVRQVHASILNTYRDDFRKYGSGQSLLRLQRIFDRLPGIIGRKIKYTEISREDQSKEIRSSIELLHQARVLRKVNHSACSGLPLAYQADDLVYKIYFLDIGLLNHQLGVDWQILRKADQSQLLSPLLTQGMQAEQFIFQNLNLGTFNEDASIYYWLREGKATNAELDFVIGFQGQILPIEVKSGKSGSLRSLHQFISEKKCLLAIRFDFNLPSLQRVHHKVVGSRGVTSVSFQLLSLPLYLVGQLQRVVTDVFYSK